MNKELSKWIEDYDNMKEVETVEMGGISQRYECAIQDLAIEIMRNLQLIKIPEIKEDFSEFIKISSDAAVDLLDGKYGFSGAQADAAKNLAAIFWNKTPEVGIQMMMKQDPDRVIKIKKGENDLPKLINSKMEA